MHSLSILFNKYLFHDGSCTNQYGYSQLYYYVDVNNKFYIIKHNLQKYPEPLKPLDPFGTEKQKKVHRLTNYLQGLQKVVVKYFSWNIIPWNALLFEKTVKQYQFSLTRITDLF